MQAGLSRAIPMAIIGFMFGALLVIVIRGLQGLDPLWSAGPGLVLSVFMAAGFWVWGMGAFDPKLSAHGEAEEAAHTEIEAEAAQPRSILLGATWQIATAVLLVVIVIGGFAILPGGFGLIQTVVPGASTAMVGYTAVQLPLGGPEIPVSTLVVFAVFIIWAFISLVVAAGAVGWLLVFFARGIAEVQTAGAGVAALPAPKPVEEVRHEARQSLMTFMQVLVGFLVLFVVADVFLGVLFPHMQLPALSWLADAPTQILLVAVVIAAALSWIMWGRERFMLVAPFVIGFVVLYTVFYYVAIGLIFPNPQLPGLSIVLPRPQDELIFLSFVNAVLFTLIILRTQLVLRVIGLVARWLAHVLRSVPRFLQ